MLADRLDGVALSSTNASAVLGANESTIKLAFSKLHDTASAEAVNKKLTAFLNAYNDQLSALAADGTMLRLYEKYFPNLPYPTQMYQYWPMIQQQVAKETPR
jgi:polar amino acid transport system substrate-binding protein